MYTYIYIYIYMYTHTNENNQQMSGAAPLLAHVSFDAGSLSLMPAGQYGQSPY